MDILFATTNNAKIKYYATKLKELGYEVKTLNDLNINIDVEENGNSPVENAIIKAKAYNKISKMLTISLDDGLYLNNLPDEIQPKNNVRRVNGKNLTDNEMIEYYTNLVSQYGIKGKLKGYFLKGIALVYNEQVFCFEKELNRVFLDRKSQIINEGYPLASIQFIPELNKFKSELTKEEEEQTIDIDQKDIFDFIVKYIDQINKNT